jgi:hypothetical protein
VEQSEGVLSKYRHFVKMNVNGFSTFSLFLLSRSMDDIDEMASRADAKEVHRWVILVFMVKLKMP